MIKVYEISDQKYDFFFFNETIESVIVTLSQHVLIFGEGNGYIMPKQLSVLSKYGLASFHRRYEMHYGFREKQIMPLGNC